MSIVPPSRRGWLPTVVACVLAALNLAQPVRAQSAKPDATGPAKVVLKDNVATFNLPAGYIFLGPERTQKLLNERGGGASGNELGLVLSQAKGSEFAIFLSYDKQGYVEDKDGDKIDADAILKNMKEGTEQSNERRKANGLAPMHVTGWEEKPSYDKARHLVVWSIEATSEGAKGDKSVVNYNTRLLGREGVLSVNLATDTAELAKFKPESGKIQSAIEFNQGKRYADYKVGDKISAGGIAALIVGGVLLKKAGILGFLIAFMKPMLIAGWKFLAVGFAAMASYVKRLFGRKNRDQR